MLADIFIFAIVVLNVFTFVMFVVGPKMLLQPKRSTGESYRKRGLLSHPSEVDLPYDDFVVSTTDNFKLAGWLFKQPSKAKGTIMYLHGIGDNKALGIPYAKLFFDAGYNVVLFDFRAHGESEGKYCTYGFFEKYDVQNVIDFLFTVKDMHVGNIGIFGLSMGVAIALQTASIDSRISAVIAENSFATLRTIFDDYQRRIIKLPFHYVRNLVILRSERMASFKASYVSPLEVVKSIAAPLLFIYSTMDEKIHYRYSIMLYNAANAQKELFPVQQAKHANAREVAGKMYDEKILSFYEKNLQ